MVLTKFTVLEIRNKVMEKFSLEELEAECKKRRESGWAQDRIDQQVKCDQKIIEIEKMKFLRFQSDYQYVFLEVNFAKSFNYYTVSIFSKRGMSIYTQNSTFMTKQQTESMDLSIKYFDSVVEISEQEFEKFYNLASSTKQIYESIQ